MPKKYAPTPKTDNTYAQVRYNAVKHGALSRIPVLPWENETAHTQLQEELIDQYKPQGPAETHLVLELAKCIISKQRLYQAEKSHILNGMEDISNYSLKGVVSQFELNNLVSKNIISKI